MGREELFNEYQKYVDITITKKFPERVARLNHLTKDDLTQIGNEALWKAVLNYEQYSHRFRAYVINCIKGAISTFMNRKGSVITFPVRETNDTKSAVTLVDYDSKVFKEEGDMTYSEIIPNDEMSVEDIVMSNMNYETMLSTLDERDRNILEYSLLGKTSTEVSKLIGMSQAGVSWRLRKILSKFKEYYEMGEVV